MDIWMLLTIFMLACFVGYFVVWGVTPALHSPLMSVSNAISGVVIVGALIIAGIETFDTPKYLGLAAVFLAAVNIFGGFAVSHRMLLMFKKPEKNYCLTAYFHFPTLCQALNLFCRLAAWPPPKLPEKAISSASSECLSPSSPLCTRRWSPM